MITIFQFILLMSILHIQTTFADVKQKFEDNEIVPDIINHPPKTLLQVSYLTNLLSVHLGNEIEPKNTLTAPKVTLNNLNPDDYFTLIMTDPDAPSRKNPIKREFCHWLVVNIKNSLSNGMILKDYFRPAPPFGTGLHRYVFLFFKQPQYLNFENEQRVNGSCRTSRPHFSTKKFVQQYRFEELISGNFFFAGWDNSVPVNRTNTDCPF